MPPGVMDDVVVLPYNDLERTERLLRDNADDLACVIMEPVASSFGYLPGDPDFLKGVRDVTEELGILLVYDEVQSLRVAPGGAQGLFGVTPDVTAMGKIVGRRNARRGLRRPRRRHVAVRPPSTVPSPTPAPSTATR